MIDLEREVREVLERRAEEAAGRAGDRMMPEMRSRVRRRQARTVVMSGLAVALVAVGALAGARALAPTTEREPGTGATIPPEPLLEPAPEMTVVASGEFRGHSWKLVAGRERQTWCFGVDSDTGRGSSCAQDLLARDPMEASTFSGTGFPAVLVTGAVSKEVDRVVFDFDAGGRLAGTVYPTPREMKAPFDVFLIVIPEERSVRGLVLALDAEGNVVARHGVYQTLVLEDRYGNVVGFVPASESDLFSSEWAEPGTSAGEERIEDIRFVAGLTLTDISPAVRKWWADRPPADAPDDAFSIWWASYPVTGPSS